MKKLIIIIAVIGITALPSTILLAEDTNSTGEPFQYLQTQIDELRIRIDSEHEIASFRGSFTTSEMSALVTQLGEGTGFVITDIVVRLFNTSTVYNMAGRFDLTSGGEVLFSSGVQTGRIYPRTAEQVVFNFESGIPISAGGDITFVKPGAGNTGQTTLVGSMNISGYYIFD